MRKIIYLLAFTTTLSAQTITVLDAYKPVQLIGDTLFINKEGYDVVKVIKPYEFKSKNPIYPKHKFRATFYIPYTDSIDSYTLLQSRYSDVSMSLQGSKGFKKNQCITQYDYNDNNVYESISIRCKDCNWDFPITHISYNRDIGFKEKEKETPYIFPSATLFPGLQNTIDSVALLLQYGENQTYSFQFKYDGTMDAEIHVSDECSNYQTTKIPRVNTTDLETYLENIFWPVVKVESRVRPYIITFSYDYNKIMAIKAEKEIKTGFKNSIKIFEPVQDSLFAVVDTFNNRTFIYDVVYSKDLLFSLNRRDFKRLIDFDATKRVDIDNDGIKDVILDTTAEENSVTLAYVQGNNLLRNEKHITASLYDRLDYLTYSKNIGNSYFYNWEKEENSEWVQLFRMEKGHLVSVLEFSKQVPGKRYNGRRRIGGWDYHHNIYTVKTSIKYQYQTYVLNNKQLTRKTKNPLKAIALKKEMIKLVEYCLDHPDQLNRIFENKK